jgi:hypothetical protein
MHKPVIIYQVTGHGEEQSHIIRGSSFHSPAAIHRPDVHLF